MVALAEWADPIANAARFADRPLLLANGDDDTRVRPTGNERFSVACRTFYQHPERLRFDRYSGVGHSVPPVMWQSAREWLCQWLLCR